MSAVTRAVLRVFPRCWRERYADEIADMLEHSRRPRRDLLEVALAAATARVRLVAKEVAMSVTSGTRLLAAVLAGLALIAFGFAVNDLAHGITEVPQHWWSVLPLAVLGAAAGLWALSTTARFGGRRAASR